MPYEIGDIIFDQKSDITKRCQTILHATPFGEAVSEKDRLWLLRLFRYHDEWSEKAAGGVDAITTKRSDQGTPCFVLVRRIGSPIDISFRYTIKLIPTGRASALIPQRLIDYRDAARVAIEEQIRSFRDKHLVNPGVCAVTGDQISRYNCAVDHVAPLTFDRLLQDFTRLSQINPLNIKIGSLNGTVAFIEDERIRREWQRYHEDNCQLRLLTRAGNLKVSKVRLDWSSILKH